jgi:SAM-dependent methyltransferase
MTDTADIEAAHAEALYDALAPLYDDWQCANQTTPFSELVLARLRPALARWGGSAGGVGSFVDLGCATGELLLGLRHHHPHARLVGVDASAGMVRIASAKPAASGIEWVHGRLTQPLAGPPVDAVGCFYDTFNHIPDLTALDTTMKAIAAMLRPGGLFVFDVTNELGFHRWWRGRNEWRGPGWKIAIETAYDPQARVAEAHVLIDRDGIRTAGKLFEHGFTPAEVQAALDGAGLETLLADPWSPFDIDASGKTWWIARSCP